MWCGSGCNRRFVFCARCQQTGRHFASSARQALRVARAGDGGLLSSDKVITTQIRMVSTAQLWPQLPPKASFRVGQHSHRGWRLCKAVGHSNTTADRHQCNATPHNTTLAFQYSSLIGVHATNCKDPSVVEQGHYTAHSEQMAHSTCC